MKSSNHGNNQRSEESFLQNNFPVQPYGIQIQICERIYFELKQQKSKLMIIQSPTGTGKSFSLLVPVLSWLLQNRYKLKTKKDVSNQSTKNKNIPTFLLKKQGGQQILVQKQKNIQVERENNLLKIVDLEEIDTINKRKASTLKGNVNPKQQISFQIDVDSIDEAEDINKKTINNQINKEQKFIEKQINLQRDEIPVKLIFVSRTHSQLEQIVKACEQIKSKLKAEQKLLTLCLGSKDLLCCNPSINKQNPLNAIQGESIWQKCQYLLNKSSCPYSHNYVVKQLFGKNMGEVKQLTEKYALCGYYALKNAIDCADVLFLPYSSLVNKDMRSKIGINIKNSIIVFDEGHNLLDFIKSSESVEIFFNEVQLLHERLTAYLEKYGSKMKIQNKSTLEHFNYVLRSIIKSMFRFSEGPCNKGQGYKRLTTLEMIIDLGLKDVKLHKIKSMFTLLDYDKKVAFFMHQPQVKIHSQDLKWNKPIISVSQIHKIIGWLQNLYKFSEDRTVVLVKNNISNNLEEKTSLQNMSFKLFCLYSDELQNIIKSSRLTIVAGGTMQPLCDFQTILAKTPHQILTVDHIIKPEQCKIFCVNKFDGKEIRFNHQNLNSNGSNKFLQEVMNTTLKYIVSKAGLGEGIIVFIQSYKLLPIIKQCLLKEQYYPDILFDSSKQNSKKNDIFKMHSQKISKNQRSILISVMRGKLSEGINFSDDLARKLVLFGLPFPNIKAPQIVEQMKYYDQLKLDNFSGKLYYESLCLKTINQSIGRAIRHKNDWAQVFLIDKRFESIQSKLSKWMTKSLTVIDNLEQLQKMQ